MGLNPVFHCHGSRVVKDQVSSGRSAYQQSRFLHYDNLRIRLDLYGNSLHGLSPVSVNNHAAGIISIGVP